MTTTWRKEITDAMRENGETWADVVGCTLTDAQLDDAFDDDFGSNEGEPFTLWTSNYVYFPVNYDGAEWCGAAPRHPCGKATMHQGGG